MPCFIAELWHYIGGSGEQNELYIYLWSMEMVFFPSENYFGSLSHQSHSANRFTLENESDNYSADLLTHHWKFMKPVKNPVDYDGTQLLKDYLKHFECCSVLMVGAKKLLYSWPQVILFPDLLWTKPKARSGQIRFVPRDCLSGM